MKIAVASGKGGTGKTTVSTSLALLAAETQPTSYVDCDVEEPNGFLFLQPEISHSQPVSLPVPVIDEQRCTLCGRCVSICQYGALARLPRGIMVMSDMCHACGGCSLLCPAKAISEKQRTIGQMDIGQRDSLRCLQGRLNVGEAIATPIIKALKDRITPGLTILDAPPGTSCPVVSTVMDADFVLLVTEPTPFGLHDLKLAVEMVRKLKLNYGVVVNRSTGTNLSGLPILGEIPMDRRVAEAYSEGIPLIAALPEYREAFSQILKGIEKCTRSSSSAVKAAPVKRA